MGDNIFEHIIDTIFESETEKFFYRRGHYAPDETVKLIQVWKNDPVVSSPQRDIIAKDAVLKKIYLSSNNKTPMLVESEKNGTCLIFPCDNSQDIYQGMKKVQKMGDQIKCLSACGFFNDEDNIGEYMLHQMPFPVMFYTHEAAFPTFYWNRQKEVRNLQKKGLWLPEEVQKALPFVQKGGFIGKAAEDAIKEAMNSKYSSKRLDCSRECLGMAKLFMSSKLPFEKAFRTALQSEYLAGTHSPFFYNKDGSVIQMGFNGFKRWYMRAMLELMSRDDLPLDYYEDLELEEYEIQTFKDMSILERMVVYYSAGLDGHEPRTSVEISKLPLFRCQSLYIECIINHVKDHFQLSNVYEKNIVKTM